MDIFEIKFRDLIFCGLWEALTMLARVAGGTGLFQLIFIAASKKEGSNLVSGTHPGWVPECFKSSLVPTCPLVHVSRLGIVCFRHISVLRLVRLREVALRIPCTFFCLKGVELMYVFLDSMGHKCVVCNMYVCVCVGVSVRASLCMCVCTLLRDYQLIALKFQL